MVYSIGNKLVMKLHLCKNLMKVTGARLMELIIRGITPFTTGPGESSFLAFLVGLEEGALGFSW